MIIRPSQRLSIASILAAMAITTAGGLAVASNMAFRLRMPIVFAGNGNIGNNTFALPFLNPNSIVPKKGCMVGSKCWRGRDGKLNFGFRISNCGFPFTEFVAIS